MTAIAAGADPCLLDEAPVRRPPAAASATTGVRRLHAAVRTTAAGTASHGVTQMPRGAGGRTADSVAHLADSLSEPPDPADHREIGRFRSGPQETWIAWDA